MAGAYLNRLLHKNMAKVTKKKKDTGKGVKKSPAVAKKKVVKKKKPVFKAPRGMHDILPEEWPARDKFYKTVREVAEFYGFGRIEPTMLEEKDLFVRTVGEGTDIVEKEMYAIKGKGSSSLVLRPEVTASVVRSYLEHALHRRPQPQRLYYISPSFRYERPQAGRFRQFWQVGLESLGGDSDSIYDAQIIITFHKMLQALKLKDIVVGINSIGSVGDRQSYKKKLVEHYQKASSKICKDCKERLKKNPLRVLDCKVKECQPVKEAAPIILDSLSGASKTHFKAVLEFLDEVGVPYVLKPHMVRGLDYYNKTVFEIFQGGDSSELALVAGGRYDHLAEALGGRATNGIGGAMGVERVLSLVKEKYPEYGEDKHKKSVVLVYVGALAKKKGVLLLEEFRESGVSVVSNLGKSSLSGQLEAADKLGAPLALILGQKEVFEESVIIRDMKTGVQETVPIAKVVKEIKKKLK